MKSKVFIASAIVVVLLGCFFFTTNRPYELRQEINQIDKIEILKKEEPLYGYDVAMEILKTIDITEHNAFIDGLLKVEGSRIGLDPPSGFGTYIIRITYRNGEIELFSDYNNGYISIDGIVHTDNYCMDKNEFYEFLSEILGEQIKELTFKSKRAENDSWP